MEINSNWFSRFYQIFHPGLLDGEIELLYNPHAAPGTTKEKHGTWRSGCNSRLPSKRNLNPCGPAIGDIWHVNLTLWSVSISRTRWVQLAIPWIFKFFCSMACAAWYSTSQVRLFTAPSGQELQHHQAWSSQSAMQFADPWGATLYRAEAGTASSGTTWQRGAPERKRSQTFLWVCAGRKGQQVTKAIKRQSC